MARIVAKRVRMRPEGASAVEGAATLGGLLDELKPYPAYKESGVEWLGKVPEHWRVLPARAIFSEIKEDGHPNEPMLSVTISRGVLRQEDLLAEGAKKDSSNEDKSKYKLVQQDDLVYNKMRAWQGAIGISEYRGIVSPAYIVHRHNSTIRCARYVHHLFRTPRFSSEAERWSYGIASDQWSLRAHDFKKIYLCVPRPGEQCAIVRFLDCVDGRIRRVIRACERRIELLEEYKQALIHEAVTGRIDVRTGKPYPAYKDSGVEWLGKVPEHWEVRRLKRVCRLAYGDGLAVDERRPGYVPVYGSNGRVGWHDSANTKGPSIIVGRKGSFGKVNYCETPVFAIDTTFFVDYRYTHENIRWVYFLLSSLRLDTVSKDSAVPGLDRQDTYQRLVPLPPLPEQRAIVKYLDQKLAAVDRAVEATRREIELLEEFRTRLIADVVTGKLDVREVAARLLEGEAD